MHGTSGGVPVTLSGMGGLITLADPNSVPEGASPRTHDTDFNVGSVHTRPGLTSVFPASTSSAGPNGCTSATSSTWSSPSNIENDDGSYTSFGPVGNSNLLTLQGFSFSIPTSDAITGILLTLHGYASAGSDISAQLLKNGVPVGSPIAISMPSIPQVFTLGGLNILWGTSFTADDVNNHSFGVQLSSSSQFFPLATAFLDYASITVGITSGGKNFNWIGTFTQQDGTIKNIALDAGGNLYVEDVTHNPGVLTEVWNDITPNSYCVGINGPDVEYMAFSDGFTGSDMPLQYTPNWIDRITQVGPGAAPSFTPQIATSNTYAITSITQPAAKSDPTNPGTLSVLLWSAGPGSTQPGNVLTVYYAPSFVGGSPAPGNEDKLLTSTFNAGTPTYVYIAGAPFGDGTYRVTSVGNALPPGVDHFRYYFTVQTTTENYQRQTAAAGTYQMTLATMTMAVPVPGLEVGNQATVAGASQPLWDATWSIVTTVNSAEMSITGTSVTSSVATYNYTVITGANPAAGQLVTVTGTTNANGQLNVTNAVIVSASGGSTGTFTVNVSVTSATSVPETGQATTAGTIFTIDPGPADVGTGSNPILGNSTGGTLTFTGADAQLIGVGTRQGSVFFITRNGYYTCPAPPVTFTCPANTTAIVATNIPIGPPNVVARGIILTEAGQNGVPGANFFTIPTPVTYIVNNQSYTATALIINDNTSTSASFTFTDSVLLNALAVDVYGYNLFNQIEIGDCGWIASYDSRNFYGLCRNKIQNFVNLSFDGGYLPALQQGQLYPLGWTTPSDQYGGLTVSPRFGNAYYISNTSGGLLGAAGSISQGAYQDAYKVPILNANTTYSVRVACRIPSAQTTGELVMSLTANGINYGQFVLPFSQMSSAYSIYTGTLLTAPFTTVPSALMLNVEAANIGSGADLEIDRIEIYPTEIPILTTTVYGSYAGLPEQVDAVTGQVGVSSENQQPVNGGMVMYDTLYLLKGQIQGASMYSLQSSPNLEPAQWQEPEVAQKSGSIGILSYDFGEQWLVVANRNGVYVFEGGQPGKITQEIYQVWDAIYWPSAKGIWVKNDVIHRKLYVGIPMPTPNFWLPDAPVNATPSTPNVVLMCNYQGLDTGMELKSMPEMHTTMFGTLNAVDMRRKWSLWQIPSPYGAIVTDAVPTLQARTFGGITYYIYEPGPIDQGFYLCNGVGNSKIYNLDESNETDDGAFIDGRYTTAGLVELSKRGQIGLPSYRLRWGYLVSALESKGTVNLTVYPNVLLGPNDPNTGYNVWTLAGGFTPGNPALNDSECSLNFVATRAYFEFRENDGHRFDLSNLVLSTRKDTWNAVRGAK